MTDLDPQVTPQARSWRIQVPLKNFDHDMGGRSGSRLLDLTTGEAVGLVFGQDADETANLAVPSWVIAEQLRRLALDPQSPARRPWAHVSSPVKVLLSSAGFAASRWIADSSWALALRSRLRAVSSGTPRKAPSSAPVQSSQK